MQAKILLKRYNLTVLYMARWQSGYAAACKAANVGSIPILASRIFGPGGGIGRRYGLKIRWDFSRAGSSPALGTRIQLSRIIDFLFSFYYKGC